MPHLLSAVLLCICQVPSAEIISDLVSSAEDERRARELKAEKFWRPVLEAANHGHAATGAHESVYEDLGATIAGLPAENEYVRIALGEALAALRRADAALAQHAAASLDTAAEQLATGAAPAEHVLSFLGGSQGFIAHAVRRFVGGQYEERIGHDIKKRQADVLPVLRSAASSMGDVLKDCSTAKTRSFDVLKYDIYNRGVSKTPVAAKSAADLIIEASTETRRGYMKVIMDSVSSLTQDVENRHEDPAATVTRSLLESMDVGSGNSASSTDRGM